MKTDTAFYIIAMRKATGLSQAKFAALFGIPTATLQDWEHGRRTPPEYIPMMMKTILQSQDKPKNK